MLASYRWLCELAGFSPDPIELAERFTFSGLEVDSIRQRGAEFDGIVVAEILNRAPHPTRNNLHVVQVFDGESQVQVVCGAPNCPGPGTKVVLARIGATVGDIVIAPRELAGVPSSGMLCSAAELDIGWDNSGILLLAGIPDAPGTPLAAALSLTDWIYEIGVTPNRPDALYHRGLAREMCLLYGRPFAPPLPVPGPVFPQKAADVVSVTIADEAAAPRYAAAVLRGVRVQPSPPALQARLHNLGIRPISNVVDITNAILMEFGQPLHAFDLNRLAGGRIIVRRAQEGETMVTLDGANRTLIGEDLLICDGQMPVALAGVMGGRESEVTDETTDILIECACFNPSVIRRTSRRMKLASEASYRFERGVDPNHAPAVLEVTCAMVHALCGGATMDGIVDCYPQTVAPLRVPFRPARYAAIMGRAVELAEAAGVLRGIGAGVVEETDRLLVDIPTFRPDMSREIDLIEEVARITGMDRIEPELPRIQCRTPDREEFEHIRQTRQVLSHLGLQDAVTYSFVPAELLRSLSMEKDTVRIANPLNAERATLRTTLLAGLLENRRRAASRYIPSFHQFEVARTYHAREGNPLPEEVLRVAALLHGPRPSFFNEAGVFDFYDARGLVEQLCAMLSTCPPTFTPAARPYLHDRRCCEVWLDGVCAGVVGELHPRCLSAHKLDRGAVCFELQMDVLRAARRPARAVPLMEYPPMTRDVAFVVPLEMDAEQVRGELALACGELAVEVRVFDIYTGEHVAPDSKSLAISVQYRAGDRTLTDREVDERHGAAVAQVCARFQVSVR